MSKKATLILLATITCLCAIAAIPAAASQVGPPYPTALQNASFGEHPYSSQTAATNYYVGSSSVPGWDTSDPSNQLEIWHTGFKAATQSGQFQFDAAAGTGNWFAELNANSGPPTSIWQDLSITPGALYQWSFLHRGRNGQDTAMMVLGPSGPYSAASGVKPANAQNAFGGTEIPDAGVTNQGADHLIARKSGASGNPDWARHLGYYQDTINDTVTYQLYSFASVAGVASNPTTAQKAEGNLVDDATWTMIAAPTTTLVLSGTKVDPNIVGAVNTPGGFTGRFHDSYDFTTPGSKTVVVDVYDASDNLVGSVTSVVNVYVYLQVRFANEDGEYIAADTVPVYYPANFADNDPADFASADYTYDVTALAPATITYGGVSYELRSSDPVSLVGDPTGDSPAAAGTLSGNTVVTFIYTPVMQNLTVYFVDEDGNLLRVDTVQLPNGSSYRVAAPGATGDLNYLLTFSEGGTNYNFDYVASAPIGAFNTTDPTTGVMDGDKTVVIVYSEIAKTYDVGGTITGLPGALNAGVTINYTIDGVAGSTTTDGAGDYLIADIPAGSEVIIHPPSNVDLGASGTYSATPINEYDIANLSGDSLNNNFNYVVTWTATGVVSSTLPGFDPAGIQIDYRLTGPLGNTVEGSVLTEADGSYTIAGIPDQSQALVITIADSYTDAVNGACVIDGTDIYTLTNITGDRPNNNFAYVAYVPTYTWSGTVTGFPDVANITIHFSVDGIAGTTTTNAFGYYEIDGIPAGAEVIVEPLPNATYNAVTYLAGPWKGYDEVVTDNAVDKDFNYIRTYTASGNVSGLPGDLNGGATLSYSITGPISLTNIEGTVVTDASGYYEIPGIPASGRIIILPPATSPDPNYSVTPITGYDNQNVTADVPNNDFVYRMVTHPVTGTVYGLPAKGDGSNGNAGISISYVISDADSAPYKTGSVITDSNGYYMIVGIPNGYSIFINTPSAVTGYNVAPIDPSAEASGYEITNMREEIDFRDFEYTTDPEFKGEKPIVTPTPDPIIKPKPKVTPTPLPAPKPSPRVTPTPANPTRPSTPTRPQNPSTLPKTGDATTLAPLIMLLLGSMGAAGSTWKHKHTLAKIKELTTKDTE